MTAAGIVGEWDFELWILGVPQFSLGGSTQPHLKTQLSRDRSTGDKKGWAGIEAHGSG